VEVLTAGAAAAAPDTLPRGVRVTHVRWQRCRARRVQVGHHHRGQRGAGPHPSQFLEAMDLAKGGGELLELHRGETSAVATLRSR